MIADYQTPEPPPRRPPTVEESERSGWIGMIVALIAFLIAGIALALLKSAGQH